MKYDSVHAVALMRMAVKELIGAGVNEMKIKKMATSIIIEQALRVRTSDEQLEFLISHDLFSEYPPSKSTQTASCIKAKNYYQDQDDEKYIHHCEDYQPKK